MAFDEPTDADMNVALPPKHDGCALVSNVQRASSWIGSTRSTSAHSGSSLRMSCYLSLAWPLFPTARAVASWSNSSKNVGDFCAWTFGAGRVTMVE